MEQQIIAPMTLTINTFSECSLKIRMVSVFLALSTTYFFCFIFRKLPKCNQNSSSSAFVVDVCLFWVLSSNTELTRSLFFSTQNVNTTWSNNFQSITKESITNRPVWAKNIKISSNLRKLGMEAIGYEYREW